MENYPGEHIASGSEETLRTLTEKQEKLMTTFDEKQAQAAIRRLQDLCFTAERASDAARGVLQAISPAVRRLSDKLGIGIDDTLPDGKWGQSSEQEKRAAQLQLEGMVDALAMLVYLLLRVGVLAPPCNSAQTGGPGHSLNLLGLYAFSGLTGLSAEQAIEKLRDVFGVIFKRSRRRTRAAQRSHRPRARPTPRTCSRRLGKRAWSEARQDPCPPTIASAVEPSPCPTSTSEQGITRPEHEHGGTSIRRNLEPTQGR